MILFDAVVLTDKLRRDFKAVADLLGAEKAFYVFAGQVADQVLERGLPIETERKFVEIFKAVYDDYVAAQ